MQHRYPGADTNPYLAMAAILATIPEFYFVGRIPVFDQTNWHRALDGSGLACPEIDRTLLDRYIDEFTSCGFLPAP